MQDWIEVMVRTTTEGAEVLTALFDEIDVSGVSVSDRADVAFAHDTALWDSVDDGVLQGMDEDVVVKGYIAEDDRTQARLTALQKRIQDVQSMDLGLDMGSLTLSCQVVREEDWANNWKQYYKPFRVGQTLLIKPPWETWQGEEYLRIINIDPGMAFGNGTHETTFLCMELIEKYAFAGMRALDIGTGTGILSIACVLCGANSVMAVDIDPVAVRVAQGNIDLNTMTDRITCREGNLLDEQSGGEEKADLIVANIIADAICVLCIPAAQRLRDEGVFLCSGIIRERETDVLKALKEAGLAVIETQYKGEWVAIAARKV